MIFLKNIYKLASGENITLFPKSADSFDLFVYKNGTQKNYLSLNKPTKCQPVGERKGYHQITKLTDDIICVCFDNNITVTYDN